MGVNYYAYIQSDKWRRRTKEAKKRVGYRCQLCNRLSTQVALAAHHRTYERLGHEDPNDITVLCCDCYALYARNKKLHSPPRFIPVSPMPIQKISKNTRKWDGLRMPLKVSQAWQGVIRSVIAWGVLLCLVIPWFPLAPSLPTLTAANRSVTVAEATVTAPQVQPGFYVTVNRGANLYKGPGTGYAVVRTAAKGAKLAIVGYTICNPDLWYQLDVGQWVAGVFVDVVRANVPYVETTCMPGRAAPTPARLP